MENKAFIESDGDFYDGLPKEIQELLMESREQIKNGNVFLYDDVISEFRATYKISK